MPDRPHINKEGLFQSDKYTWCKPNFVPLKIDDPMAQDLLWEYAQRRRKVDKEFASDLEFALQNAGYVPGETEHAPDCAIMLDAGEPGSAGLGCTCGRDAVCGVPVAVILADGSQRTVPCRGYVIMWGGSKFDRRVPCRHRSKVP